MPTDNVHGLRLSSQLVILTSPYVNVNPYSQNHYSR